jgi:leucine dehydrogenase
MKAACIRSTSRHAPGVRKAVRHLPCNRQRRSASGFEPWRDRHRRLDAARSAPRPAFGHAVRSPVRAWNGIPGADRTAVQAAAAHKEHHSGITKGVPLSVFDSPHFDGHERVVHISDAASGLRAIIAMHSTRLGPAIGGCRAWTYAGEDAALADVLRLSRGMTYKAACANVPFGGGKCVMLLGPTRPKNADGLRALGRAIQGLGGQYITGEDVGTTTGDMATLREVTPHVLGVPTELGGSGDPSASTAMGVLVSIRAAVRRRLGRNSLDGVRVAVQGLGNVGFHLCELLAAEGARLWATDVKPERIAHLAKSVPLIELAPDQIYGADVDVFAPCALGAIINDHTLPQLRAKVIAGGANNQLELPRHADALNAREILYAPDYVVNAGGMIQLSLELRKNLQTLQPQLEGIAATLDAVFDTSERDGITTAEAAEALARQRISEGLPSRGAT